MSSFVRGLRVLVLKLFAKRYYDRIIKERNQFIQLQIKNAVKELKATGLNSQTADLLISFWKENLQYAVSTTLLGGTHIPLDLYTRCDLPYRKYYMYRDGACARVSVTFDCDSGLPEWTHTPADTKWSYADVGFRQQSRLMNVESITMKPGKLRFTIVVEPVYFYR